MSAGAWLVLGGAGLVGHQVCRRLLRDVRPARLVVASLRAEEVAPVLSALRAEFPGADLVAEHGDLFLPDALADRPRASLQADPAARAALLDALYGDLEAASRTNRLCVIVRRHAPEGVVDCVNTATGLSYQDVFDGAQRLRDHLARGLGPEAASDIETLLLSQSVPQIVRHVSLVDRVLREVGARHYVKVGTTGTGGMGLNIPYTHGEDRPSRVLMAKTEAGFGHTGLLFLMARTPGGPAIHEIKPGAMIGYKGIATMAVRRKGEPQRLVAPKVIPLGGPLHLADDPAGYEDRGPLEVAVVDTGENGVFSRGEFAAITAMGQMEFVTPEEIAGLVIREVTGHATGREMVAALDASVLGPSYKAGLLRGTALHDLAIQEASSGRPSIALGQLGPPELSKLLFEAHLLVRHVGGLAQIAAMDPAAAAATCQAHLTDDGLDVLAPSIGVPILLGDGVTLLRGPRLNVPEMKGLHRITGTPTPADWNAWATKGWVDLRASNFAIWRDRAVRMRAAGIREAGAGSAASTIASAPDDGAAIGEIVAWVLANELAGHRVD